MADENVVHIPPDKQRLIPPQALGDGGGGTFESRVTRLEEWARLSDERAKRVEDKLDAVLQIVSALPSRAEFMAGWIGGLGAVFALLALLIGGMAWLDGRQASRMAQQPTPATQPIVIQVPAAAPAPDPAPRRGR